MEQLIKYLDSIKKLNNENINEYIELIDEISTKDKIEVVVTGELSNGKSTLINALLKRDILPTGIGATTSKIIFIQKGESRVVSDNSETLLKNSDDENAEIIEDIIKTNSNGKVYIYLNDFLFDNIVLIDTPGVNDTNEERKLLTYGYAPYSDVVIFLADITKGFTKFEKEFFENLHESIKEKTFVLFNKIDTIKKYDKNKPNEYLASIGLKDLKSYGISASLALDGILDKNNQDIEISQIEEFLSDLKEFMNKTDKNELLKARAIKILNKINELANEQIGSYLRHYDSDLNEVIDELTKVEENLKKLSSQFKIKKREVGIEVAKMTTDIYNSFADLQTHLEAKLNILYNVDTKVEFLQTKLKHLIDEALKEIEKISKGTFESLNFSMMEFKNIDIAMFQLEKKLSILSKTNKKLSPLIEKIFKLKKLEDIDIVIKSYIKNMLNKIEESIEASIAKLEEELQWQLKEKLEKLEAKRVAMQSLIEEKRELKDKKSQTKEVIQKELKEINELFRELKESI